MSMFRGFGLRTEQLGQAEPQTTKGRLQVMKPGAGLRCNEMLTD
jgi:hypothetical protein